MASARRRPRPYQRLCRDGLAYIAYAEQDDIDTTLKQEKIAEHIVADESVAFRMVSREVTREYILIPSA